MQRNKIGTICVFAAAFAVGLLTVANGASRADLWAGSVSAALAAADAGSSPRTGSLPAPTAVDPGSGGPDMRQELESVFDKQKRNGDISFGAADSIFYHHPVLATLSLETFRRTRDLAFLQKAHRALKGYFNYLLVYRDTDRDLLVERSTVRGTGGGTDVEDPGFNAILALDMLSLSQICIELGMPADALFWYRGTRAVSEKLVRTTYDPGSSTFLPAGSDADGRARGDDLSVLPAYFTSELGDEVPLRVIRRHLLNGDPSQSSAPAKYLSWEFSPGDGVSAPFTDRLLRTVLLLGVLERNGLGADAGNFARRIAPLIDAEMATPSGAQDEVSRYLAGLIQSGGPFALFPRNQGLAVLDELVFRKSLLDPEQVAALRRSSAAVRAHLEEGDARTDPVAGTAGTAARAKWDPTDDIRQVYFSISLLREKWKQRSLFAETERTTASGFDLYTAASELFEDVVGILKTAENLGVENRWRAEGFDLAVTLEKTSTGPGEPVPVRFSLTASTDPVAIQSITVLRQQSADTLVSASSSVVVTPGGGAREYGYAYPAPRGGESTLVPLAFSVEIRFDGGKRDRLSLRKSVFVTRPVTCAVRFPNGTTLANGSVPIEILVTKHLPPAVKIQAEWYSPAGLKPAEGRSVEASMPENTKEASLFLNILVPNPCRPGSFPFTLKVFADGKEVGTVASKLFKHYEWLFVGPFPGKKSALDTRYPPEGQLNLFDTYTGAVGQLVWQILPISAFAHDGRLSLGELLADGGVGFLYTVIETAAPRATTAVFESSAPAALYVNGEVAARATGANTRQRVAVRLKGGMNNVLVKTHATSAPSVFFQLGDEEDLMADEFNNNLWELVDGYQELVSRDRAREDEKIQRRVTLTFRDPGAASVAVVGSFNGWSPANSSMRKNKYGEWEIGLFLAPGRYTYRFMVNESVEMVDPGSPYTEPDGYGGQNSVLYVQ